VAERSRGGVLKKRGVASSKGEKLRFEEAPEKYEREIEISCEREEEEEEEKGRRRERKKRTGSEPGIRSQVPILDVLHPVLEPHHSSRNSERMDLQPGIDEGEELAVEADGSSWRDN